MAPLNLLIPTERNRRRLAEPEQLNQNGGSAWNRGMKIDELEKAALVPDPQGRAPLAERLLESLENLSPEEHARIWAEEAPRRAVA